MNERIRDIKDKLWSEEYWNNPNTDKLLSAQLNRFAELIVEECINVCKSRVGNSDYNTGRLHCVSDIRERFEFGMTTEDKKNLIKELLRVNK